MATIVRPDDSQARAFQQLLSLGLNMDQRRRDRQFEQAKYLNSIGKNPEAEQLLAQSQRSPLRNLFAGEAEGRKFDSAFADLNPEDKPLLDVPKLNAQQEILAELQSLYDGDQAGYQQNIQALAAGLPDAERAKRLQGLSDNQKIYEAAANAYRSQYGNDLSDADIKAQYQQDFFRGGKLLNRNDLPDHIRDAYLSSRAEVERLSGYNPMDVIRSNEQAIQRRAQILAQNEAIKKANANKPYKAVLEGDEEDVVNAETENAYRAIQNAGSYDDKLRAYGKYVNSLTNLRRSFQGKGDFRPLSMEQMGISKPKGKGSGGGASEKLERAYVYNQDGKRIESVFLTKSEFNDPNRNQILFDKYKTIADRGGDPSLINVSFASGTSKEPDPMIIAAMKEAERKRIVKDENAIKMLNQWTGWNVGSEKENTLIKDKTEAMSWLKSRGYEVYKNSDGDYAYRKPQQNKSVSNWLE